MANRQATGYTLLFATAICIVCGILVSSFAVSLEDLQDANIALDKQKRVLEAVGKLQPGEPIDEAQVAERFAPIEPVLIELTSGEAVDGDTATFDQQRRARDPATSTEAPGNLARVKRVPDRALLYEMRGDGGELEMIVLPIEGLGPHRVDGLAGATITSNGVTNMLDFWLGENGFEPYLNRIRAEAN